MDGHGSGRRVARNVIYGVAAQLLAMTLGFIVTPVLLKTLGISVFGAFAVIGSLTSYIGVLDFGIGASLMRFMTFYHERRDEQRVREFATFGVIFYMALGLLLFPLVFVAAPAVGQLLNMPVVVQAEIRTLLSIVLGLFIASATSGVLTARLAALHRLDIAALANIAGVIVYTLSVLFVVPHYPNLLVVFCSMAAQIATSALVMWAVLRSHVGTIAASPFSIRWTNVKELFSFGVWTQLSSITAVINLEADKAVISSGIGVDNVTPYQVANRLALLNRTFPLQIIGSLLPEITARVSRGMEQEELARLYQRTCRALALSTLVISGLVAGSADALLRLWLGTRIDGASTLCVALIASYALNNLTGIGTVVLKAQGKPRLETTYGAIAAVLNVALTIILIKPLGLYGVVIGTIAGSTFASIFFILVFHRMTRLSWWRTTGVWLLPMIAVAASAGVAVWLALDLLVPTTLDRLELFAALGTITPLYLLLFLLLGRALSIWTPGDFAIVDRLKLVLGRRFVPAYWRGR